jgi:hypothetical protein
MFDTIPVVCSALDSTAQYAVLLNTYRYLVLQDTNTVDYRNNYFVRVGNERHEYINKDLFGCLFYFLVVLSFVSSLFGSLVFPWFIDSFFRPYVRLFVHLRYSLIICSFIQSVTANSEDLKVNLQ